MNVRGRRRWLGSSSLLIVAVAAVVLMAAVTASAGAASAPAVPTGVKVAVAKGGKAVVTWKASAGAHGYVVFLAKPGSSVVKARNGQRRPNRALHQRYARPGKTYAFRVKAYKRGGGKMLLSAFSGAVSLKVPARIVVGKVADRVVLHGQTATFSVSAKGTSPAYQWYKNGARVDGATGSSYTTPATSHSENDGDRYFCKVSNIINSATTNSARLTVRPPGYSGIVADHTVARLANLNSISAARINRAKAKLKIAYWHTSHGSQIVTGMDGLAAWKGGCYQYSSTPGFLTDTWSTDLGDDNWSSLTDSYLKYHPSINVVIWSWCGQVSWKDQSAIAGYLSKMSALEAKYPKVTFVYMTGHLDGTGSKGNLHLRNQQIRAYCEQHNKVLFDFADIESYDPDGTCYLDRGGDDECNYLVSGAKVNWAQKWQAAHTKGVEWYQCDCAHSQPLNGNMKAYAAWYLWVQIAERGGG